MKIVEQNKIQYKDKKKMHKYLKKMTQVLGNVKKIPI